MDNHHKKNSKCYHFKLLTISKPKSGLFDNCIDMAYLLTMTNSKRTDAYLKQLYEHIPVSRIKIQYNKGFRNCKKILTKKEVKYDLTDAVRNVFFDAVKNKYNSILVLEDDFFMDKKLYDKTDTDEICRFINKNKPHVYNLGPAFHFSFPIEKNHLASIYFTTSHMCIYNLEYMLDFIINYKDISDCDQFWNIPKYKKFCYKKPIGFQIYDETENRSGWSSDFADWNLLNGIKRYDLHKSHKNYTTVFNTCTGFSTAILISIILVVIIIPIIIIIIINKKTKKD